MSALVARLRASAWLRGSRAHTLVTFGTNALQGAVGLLTGVLAARLLGPSGRGELAAIQAVATIVVTLGTFGLFDAVVYYASREPETGAKDSVVTTVSLLAAGLLFVPAAWLALPWVLPHQRPGVLWGARIYLFVFPAFVLLGTVQSMLRASGRLVRWNAVRMLAQSFWLVVVGAAWFMSERVPELLAACYAALLCGVALVVVLGHRALWSSGFPVAWHRLRRLFRYGLPLSARTGSRALNVRLDVVVMAALLTSADVGIYSVAATWSMMLSMLPAALGAVLFPRLSRERDPATRDALERKALLAGSAAILAGALVLAALTPWLLPLLFGPEFDTAAPYAVGLLASGVILATSQLLEAVVQGRGRTGVLFGAEVAGLAVTVAGLVVFLPRLRIWGAVLTSTLAYATVTGILALWLLRVRRESVGAGEPA
jgi:O-antigen/teichoic acid export membrane protein